MYPSSWHCDLSICFDPMWEKPSTFLLQLQYLSCFSLLKEGKWDFEKEAPAYLGFSQELRKIMDSFHLDSNMEREAAASPREMSVEFKVNLDSNSNSTTYLIQDLWRILYPLCLYVLILHFCCEDQVG